MNVMSAIHCPRRMPTEVDMVLLWSALALLFTGLVMVYSACRLAWNQLKI